MEIRGRVLAWPPIPFDITPSTHLGFSLVFTISTRRCLRHLQVPGPPIPPPDLPRSAQHGFWGSLATLSALDMQPGGSSMARSSMTHLGIRTCISGSPSKNSKIAPEEASTSASRTAEQQRARISLQSKYGVCEELKNFLNFLNFWNCQCAAEKHDLQLFARFPLPPPGLKSTTPVFSKHSPLADPRQ